MTSTFGKDVGYEGCWSIAPKKSKTSLLAETQHLVVNETVRYNVKLTHIDLDCSCLLLHKLLHPFIIANGYPVDSMTRKEAVELGHIEVEIKVLLEYLFELSSKSRTFYKWCNDEDIVADGGSGASTMTCKHSAKRGESVCVCCLCL